MLQHRDRICIQKIIQEISIGMDLIGDATLKFHGRQLRGCVISLRISIRLCEWKMSLKLHEKIFLC